MQGQIPKSLPLFFWALVCLNLALFLRPIKAHAGIFGPKRTWCDRPLQKDPAEIAIFKDDLAKAIKGGPWVRRRNWGVWQQTASTSYSSDVAKKTREIFQTPPYSKASPELKARLISYLLVEGVQIPAFRNDMVALLSNWLFEELEHEKGYSTTDLDRIKLSFNIFTARRATYFTRNNGRRLLPFLKSAIPDLGLTVLGKIIYYAAAEAMIPGITIIPIPFFFAATAIRHWNFKNSGDPLLVPALTAVNRVDAKINQMLGAQLPIGEMGKRWNESLKSVIGKNSALIAPELLKALTTDHCASLKSTPEISKEIVARHMSTMVRSLKSINAFYWEEIFESFKIIRATAVAMGFTRSEVQPVLDAMKEVSESWSANGFARESVERLVNQTWLQTALPE